MLSILPAFLPLSALQTVCPLLAALLLVQLREGAQGTWDFVRRVLDPRLQTYAWYTPALLVAPVAAALASSRTPEWIVWWSLGTVSQRVLKMWLHNASGRVVVPVAVFHASVNLGISWLPNNGDPDPAIFALILAVAAAVVTLVWGPITLATSRPDLRRRLFGRRLHRLKASKESRKETD